MPKPIALIGFYGSGKVAVGRRIAGQLAVPFCDLSDEIERLSGMRLPALYRSLGDLAFREFESLALSSAAAAGGVLATTGGCVMLPYNRRILCESFYTVFLDASFPYAYEHLGTQAHPSIEGLTRNELQRLYELRRPLYVEMCNLSVDAAKDPATIADVIINSALSAV